MSLKFISLNFSNFKRGLVRADEAARFAQAKFDKWLSEQPLAHGTKNQFDITDGSPDSFVGCTHTARIVDIQEIKPKECTHNIVSYPNITGPITVGTCCICGIELVARWESKK